MFVKFLVYLSLIYFSLFVIYRVFVKKSLSMGKRLNMVKELTDPDRVVLDEDRDKIEHFIESGKLYRIPILGGFYEEQISSLVSANIPMKPKEYFIATVAIFMAMFVIGFLGTGLFVIGLLFATVGLILPSFYVGYLKSKRKGNLDKQLPEFLNTLANGLRSGLSLNQGIAIAVEESPDPVKWEFERVLKDLNVGRRVEDALGNLKDRTNNENIDLLVNAIIIQREAGGNLSEILDILAETIRENEKLQRYFKSTIAQNKLSGIIIGLLPIGLAAVLTVMSPEYMMPLYQESIGRIMLLVALSMMALGMFIIKKITEMEV